MGSEQPIACMSSALLHPSLYTSQAMHMLEASFIADSIISASGCVPLGKDE